MLLARSARACHLTWTGCGGGFSLSSRITPSFASSPPPAASAAAATVNPISQDIPQWRRQHVYVHVHGGNSKVCTTFHHPDKPTSIVRSYVSYLVASSQQLHDDALLSSLPKPKPTRGFVNLRFPFTAVHRSLAKYPPPPPPPPRHRSLPFPTLSILSPTPPPPPISKLGPNWCVTASSSFPPSASQQQLGPPRGPALGPALGPPRGPPRGPPPPPPGWEFRVAREVLLGVGGGRNFSSSSSSSSSSSAESSRTRRMTSSINKPKPGESGMDRIGVAPLPPEECPIDDQEDDEDDVILLADFTPPLTEGMMTAEGEGGMEGTRRLLVFEGDMYDGVIIDPTCLPTDGDMFLSTLRSSLTLWESQQRKGVWLKLPRENANLVPIAISEGFDFHHAELHYVMLTKWLPPTLSTLPPNASHQVGVGAFVVNDRREILAVQEKYGFLRGKNVWKLPTGLVSQQEDIWTAAVREVKEETGIEAEFMEIITFRQAHSAAFGKSDLFMICALKPVSFEITKQDAEIEAAQWMPLDEFMGQPFLKTREMFMRMLRLCVAHLDGRYKGLRPINVPAGVDPSSTAIYCCDLTTEASGFFVKPH